MTSAFVGGEEFVVLLPETGREDARSVFEAVRDAVGSAIVNTVDRPITVSVGVASYPEDGLNPQEVIVSADEALYRAKDSGKNCVIWA